MNITKGLRGRPKTYTFTLSIPLVSSSTAEDKVITLSATSQLRCSSSSMCACSKACQQLVKHVSYLMC
jgi:hypothetical protein